MSYSGTEIGPRLSPIDAAAVRNDSTLPFRVFFNGADLNNILAGSNCVGIRFYPGKRANGENTTIAVGVLGNHDEIGPDFILSEGAAPSTILTQAQAEANTTSFPVGFSAYLSKVDILELLATTGSIGIRIYSDTVNIAGTDHPTYSMAAVGSNMADITTSSHIVAPLPCPPHCGSNDQYLNHWTM